MLYDASFLTLYCEKLFMNIWNKIDTQKENAIESDKEYNKFLKEILDKPIKNYFQESWKNKIPLEYHTERVGKPVYHPLTMSRVLIYFNPNRLRKNKLKEESLVWFGMSIDSLKKYVENGWIVVQLNTRETYSNRARQEIEDFFKDMEAKPIYVNIVDDLLASVLGYKTLKDFLNEKEKEDRIKKLHERWKNIIPKPIEVYDVPIDADKVKENYLRLKFLRDAFENKGDQEAVDAINVELEQLEKIKESIELAKRAYTTFLIYGTPILYCDGSGYVSVGLEPYWKIVEGNTKNIFKKIKEKAKEVFCSILKDKKILYFPDIGQPHEIIKNHFKYIKFVKNRHENDLPIPQEPVNKARELEEKIIDMIDKAYYRVEERGDYIKAFESYENEVIGASDSELNVINFGLSNGISLVLSMVGGMIVGTILGNTPFLSKRIKKTLALKYVVGDKTFGVEIKEEEIPNVRLNTLKPYSDIKFRTFKIPVEDTDPTSGEMTIAELKE